MRRPERVLRRYVGPLRSGLFQNGAPSPAPAPAPEPSGPSVPAPTPGQTAGVAGLLLLITAVALSPLGVYARDNRQNESANVQATYLGHSPI